MVIDALKIVHLGTPDSETGLTDIARGLQEIFENDADVVYVQSAEISALFAKTREIMGLLNDPNYPIKSIEEYTYRNDAKKKLEKDITSLFNKNSIVFIGLNTIPLNLLNQTEQTNFQNIFNSLSNLILSNYDLWELNFIIRPEGNNPFLHRHEALPDYNSKYNALVDHPNVNRIYEPNFKAAEILFATSEDPELTTRIVKESSVVDRMTEHYQTVSAPQDAIVIMRNGGVKPNPIHGTPLKPSNRFTFLATVSPL